MVGAVADDPSVARTDPNELEAELDSLKNKNRYIPRSCESQTFLSRQRICPICHEGRRAKHVLFLTVAFISVVRSGVWQLLASYS